jgi:hypothetical protein
MKPTALLQQRLLNQQLSSPQFSSVQKLVEWMGAIQAQDYNMAKWGIGSRMNGITDEMIESAINNAAIIRTHILRPTWHFVAAKDIRWLMDLTSPHIKRAVASQNRFLGLDESLHLKTNKIIGKLLSDGEERTRDEIAAHLKKKGITLNNLQATNCMINAELDMVVCNGKRKDKQFTYALFDKKIPSSKSLKREEALCRLAGIYFSSHGPATLHDFAWWSGLSVPDARLGIEAAAGTLEQIAINGKQYWYKPIADTAAAKEKEQVYLLPPYDEFTVAYCDRSLMIGTSKPYATYFGNGIFKPLIVKNGKAIGVWKIEQKKGDRILYTELLNSTPSSVAAKIRKAKKTYELFVDQSISMELKLNNS